MNQRCPSIAIPTLVNSLANSTIQQYHGPLRSWSMFCREFKKDEFSPSIQDVLHFLSEVKIKGASYGKLNTYRSAISLITKDHLGSHPLISRFMKGTFRERPIKPKYRMTWDVSAVLEKLKEYYPPKDLGLQNLSEKLVMLLLLTTGHRLQTIWSIKINNLKEAPDGYWADIDKLLKTTRPGSASPLLFLPKFSATPELCVFATLKEYLKQTRDKRGEIQELFITSTRPFKAASKDTLSRWVKNVLQASGVDTTQFTAHSTRHASTSTALAKGVDIETIRRTAGWSASSQIFQRYYNVPIVPDQRLFSQALFS